MLIALTDNLVGLYKNYSKSKQPEVLLFFTIMLFAKQSCPDLVDPISKVTWTLGERASLS